MVAALLLLVLLASSVRPGAVAAANSDVPPSPDSVQVLRGAREAQARFERLRRRASPAGAGWSGTGCDEIVGRMCMRIRPTGDWWPVPEPTEVSVARAGLLDVLARAGATLPGDRWIAGQRVVYLLESGDPGEAMGAAAACRSPDPGWCAGLRGLVLHAQGRFGEAADVFAGALAQLGPEEARRWLDPRELADREGREKLDAAPPALRHELVRRFWDLADPLFLVDGNDRWTEHLARQVVARTREGSENPYGLRWGDDLAEVLVRYGWEVGWERIPPRPTAAAAAPGAVGHQHPESRSVVPPGRALTALAATRPDEWNPGSRPLPRTGYAPAYAPVILPADAELLRFPRGDTLLLAGVLALPADTTWHRSHGHQPLPVPEGFRRAGSAVGLFAWRDGAVALEDRRRGEAGVLTLRLPPGEYLVSGEVWAPDSARAGRVRRGLAWEGVPRDIPTLSDLLVAGPGGGEPSSTEEMLERLAPPEAPPGDTVRVGWEIHGLGWRREEVEYHLELVEGSGGILRRVGRFLRLVGEGRKVILTWSEPAPDTPGPHLRTALLTLPGGIGEGEYLLRLRMATPGRETLASERRFKVLPPSR